MKLSFYGGAGEIGGNKILVEAEDTRLFLDFGMSYSREDAFFEFPLVRPGCIDDLFKTGVLPRLGGFYKNAGLTVSYSADGTPSVSGETERRQIDAVLLSHAHMDHYGYLGMLRTDIPVYMSPISRCLIELRNDIREDWQTRVSMDSFVISEKDTDWNVGNMRVSRFDVDHSILGASAYLLRAGDMVIAYTGDLRFHGSAQMDSEAFVQACRDASVDILLCEGTRIGPPPEEEGEPDTRALASETEVEQRIREILSRDNGLIIYDASPADMNRIALIWRVAAEHGRTVIFDSKKAYLILYLNHPQCLCPGLPSAGEFKIYISRRKLSSSSSKCSGLPEDLFVEAYTDGRQGHEDKLLVSQRKQLNPKRRPKEGEDEWLELSDDTFIWGSLRDEVVANPDRYVLYTSNGVHTLLHFFPADGRKLQGTYIYGKAEPFKEEMELSFRRLLNWIDLCGLNLEYAHTSGHMHRRDIERVVGEIEPEVVVPIHTEHPEMFERFAPRVRIPHLGETLEF